ncbi:MAG: general secretion pathway protein, partial [Gammaproteobacteria bacterium]|nr:general secretion pathway protein [Gammaproteobacteria bacterium]
ILASVAVPAYQEYVATSEGGAAMKGIGGYVSQAQTCVSGGIGCTVINATADSIVSSLKSYLIFSLSNL